MVYRPFQHIGRLGLAACAVSLGVASLSAQTAPAAPVGPNPSRVDVFLGYSYFGAHGRVQPFGLRYSSVDYGAIGSGAYYFNKYVGAEVIAVAHPDGQNDGLYTYSGGMIVRAPLQNFTLFAHGLAGAAELGGPNNSNLAQFEHEPYQLGVALTAGGGMDYDIPYFNHFFGLRLFQADFRYIHANFGPPAAGIPTGGVLGGRANLNGVDLSSGILMHFGHIIPPPPVTYTCSASPTTVYPGDPVTVTGTALNIPVKKVATYTWSSTGGMTPGGASSTTIDTKDLAAGTYTVKGHVGYGSKPGQMADCTSDFTVKSFEPPTIGCSANPSTVNAGESSTITSHGVSPQNRPLSYSYSTSAGTISGNTSTATLNTTGAAPGTITVTCNTVDDKGQTASQQTTVTVSSPRVDTPPAPKTVSLCSIGFDRDARRPARVDNEGKACLDDLALNLQRDPSAKLYVVGSAASSEKNGSKLAAERAVNVKDYLVKEKGIDASRIVPATGTQDAKTVATTLAPVGSDTSVIPMTAVDESAVMAQPRMAPAPMAKKHKKHKK